VGGRTADAGRGAGTDAAAAPDLTGVSRTLLIPLYARAKAARLLPGVHLHDPVAQDLVRRLGVAERDVGRDRFTMRLCIARSAVLERMLRSVLDAAERPRTVALLACGLDTLPQRVGTGHARWLCADLPAVTALRDRLLPASPGVTQVSAALPNELDALAGELGAEPPVFLLEGILPYLEPDEVAATLRGLADLAPQGGDVLLDGYHPALLAFARFGDGFRRMRVRFRFGIADTHDYVQLAPRLRHRAETDLLALLPWRRRLRTALPAVGARGRPLATIAHLVLMPA
jgi:O-methyltransferase involved in polyketide biosynthesis